MTYEEPPDEKVVEMHHLADFQPLPPIRYTLRFPASYQHYVEVEVSIPVAPGSSALELFLPVWTPGSYLVREYSRHLEALSAIGRDRKQLAVTKTRKNHWTIDIPQALPEITLHYRLYCHDLTVRTNFRDDTMAVLNGAATFLTVAGETNRTYEVTVELPTGWSSCWSPLPGSANRFYASDYDHLVDSPLVAGSPSSAFFEVDGKLHQLVNFGDGTYWDMQQSLADLRSIVLQHRAMWGELPYDHYLFFNLLSGGRGALEHRDSMLLMADRFTMRSRNTYREWLEVASHEFFHLWNVKRLRPMELGPFEYESEVYTRNLWIAEGFTEYYGPLAVCRAGLMSEEEFLGTESPPRGSGIPDSLSSWIEDLQNTPGRRVQSASDASFDAWIKYYRPDANSRNSSVSYYTKGAVIAWLLDARTRAATGGAGNLDDIMRLALQRYGGARGFSTEEFQATAEEVARVDLKHWFHQVAESTEELDYSEAVEWFGLRFRAALPGKSWIGCATKTEEGRLIVTEVLRGSPADQTGISPDDEILAVAGSRVRPGQWPTLLEQFRPDELIPLLVSRRDRILTLSVRVGQEPARQWLLEADPAATEAQIRHRMEWLSTDSNACPRGCRLHAP
jgi:predicted metalloprotease with PDZ domain